MGQEHSLPCRGLYLDGQPGMQEPRGDPVRGPQPAPVPVQLCEKCGAWKSLEQIAECLECKHFPEKGEQRTHTGWLCEWDKLWQGWAGPWLISGGRSQRPGEGS